MHITYRKFTYLFLSLFVSLTICSACSDDSDGDDATNSIVEEETDTDTVTNSNVYKNIVYDKNSGNAIDIYLPDTLQKENGVVLIVHGGSWVGGSKDNMAERGRMFANAGYVAATIDYTLFNVFSPNPAGADSMMNDLMRGIDKVMEMSGKHDWNINKLALYGESAGAHLSMLYAYSNHKSALPVEFVVDAIGPIDFHISNWNFESKYDSTYAILMVNGLSHANYTIDNFATEEAENSINSISPLYYINANTVPTVMAYGALDDTQNPKNGDYLSEKFTEYGVKHDLIFFENSGHELAGDPDKLIEFQEKIVEYAQAAFGY